MGATNSVFLNDQEKNNIIYRASNYYKVDMGLNAKRSDN